MADEAVLRIVLQDDGGGSIPTPTGGGGAPPQMPRPGGGVPTKPTQPPATPKVPSTPKSEDVSGMDTLLNVIGGLRGTIGGMTGTLVGSILDVVSSYKKAMSDIAKGKEAAENTPFGKFASSLSRASSNATTVSGATAAAKAGTTAAAEGAMAAGGAMSAAVPIIGLFIAATLAAAKALSELTDFIDKSAEKYGEYSPQIAQAQAVAEIRTVMGDFRRAQEVSADMAKYIKARTDVEQSYEDIKVRFLTKILPIVTRILESIDMLMPLAESGLELLTPLEEIARLVGEIKDILDVFGDKDKEPVDDPTSILFKSPGSGGVQLPGESLKDIFPGLF